LNAVHKISNLKNENIRIKSITVEKTKVKAQQEKEKIIL
jgi:hypothetical protein